MEVVQIKNPISFTVPEVGELVEKAVKSTLRVENASDIAPDVLKMVYDENAFIFLGVEDGHFKLLILGFLPALKLFPHPTIVTFYNEGSRALRDLGKMKLMDFIQAHGYNSAWGVNGTGKSDEAWKRVFGQGAVEINRVGTVFEFKAL